MKKYTFKVRFPQSFNSSIRKISRIAETAEEAKMKIINDYTSEKIEVEILKLVKVI